MTNPDSDEMSTVYYKIEPFFYNFSYINDFSFKKHYNIIKSTCEAYWDTVYPSNIPQRQ